MPNENVKLICVVGARPNLIKMAALLPAFAQTQIKPILVHTGQHYDFSLDHQFFEQLGIPKPDYHLEVGSGSHAAQTAEVMKRFEPVLRETAPRAILVVGDVNSTIACSLVAAKLSIPVAHVEAGLRSGDRRMPEEINRILTDQLSDILFTTERGARDNLLREGIADSRIHFTGNVMVDTLLASRSKAKPIHEILNQQGVDASLLYDEKNYAVATLHRPSNVDDRITLKNLLTLLQQVGGGTQIVFPVHPRTRAKLAEFGFGGAISAPNVIMLSPVGYFEMIGLMSGARFLLTDSGGLQEESTALGVPCLTLRENTERPITVQEGTNIIVGTDAAKIVNLVENIRNGKGKSGRRPEYWDGHAAERIAGELVTWLKAPS